PWQAGGRTHEASLGYAYTKHRFNADYRFGGTGFASNFNAWDGFISEPAWASSALYQQDRTKQQAIFGVVRLNLADPLRLILGSRLTDHEKRGLAPAPADLSAVPITYRMSFDREISPYVGATYDLNDTSSVYASHTDIFQPQQFRDAYGRFLNPV